MLIDMNIIEDFIKAEIENGVLGIVPDVRLKLPDKVDVFLNPETDNGRYSIGFFPDNTRLNASKRVYQGTMETYFSVISAAQKCMEENSYHVTSDKVYNYTDKEDEGYWNDYCNTSAGNILPRKITFSLKRS